MKSRVLLLNPPAEPAALRDYFCSTTPKAGYLWHPMDLLALSGKLDDSHWIHVLDAVAMKLGVGRALDAVRGISPDVVVSLVGSVTTRRDLAFLRAASRAAKPKTIVVLGEPFLSRAEDMLAQEPAIDAALFDFVTDEALAALDGGIVEPCNAAYRNQGKVVVRKRPVRGRFKLGTPRHTLFPLKSYRVPPVLAPPFASVLCSFGCPYSCAYCNSGVKSLGYAVREAEDLEKELAFLRRTGIKRIFFRDMSFAASRDARELVEVIRCSGDFEWTCYLRPDKVGQDLFEDLAGAGCRLVQFGVECADSKVLARLGRDSSTEAVESSFNAAARAGIDVGAHFVLGLPGQDEKAILETIEWAVSLNPAYASFNVFQPRFGSKLDVLADPALPSPDPSFGKPHGYRGPRVVELSLLRRKAYVRFYARPGYIAGRMFHCRSLKDFVELSKSAIRLASGLAREWRDGSWLR